VRHKTPQKELLHNTRVANSPTYLLLTRVFPIFHRAPPGYAPEIHMIRRTEGSYLHYIVAFIRFHDKCYPLELG